MNDQDFLFDDASIPPKTDEADAAADATAKVRVTKPRKAKPKGESPVTSSSKSSAADSESANDAAAALELASAPPLPADLKFEDALAQLETLVDRMEAGELSLDQCLAIYEEGMQLSTFCTERLRQTERKVEMLMRKRNGEGEWKPFDVGDDDSGEGSGGYSRTGTR